MELAKITQTFGGVVEVYDNAVDVAPFLSEVTTTRSSWKEATVTDDLIRDTNIRDNDVHWIYPFDFNTSYVSYSFVKTVWRYMNDYGLRYERSFSSLEPVNINRYLPGQQYHIHADAAEKSTRVISALVYLNDDFTGGETEFVHFDERVTPQAGRLVIFPSNYAYAHAALPPIDGVKYSAAFWVNA